MGCIVDVIAAFAVTFTSPYLLDAKYANLSSKVGFIWGGFTTFYLIWALFYLPELKNRSLEEVDELFEAKLWGWQFSKFKTKSLAGRVALHDTQGTEKAVFQEESTAAAMEIEA